MNIDQAIQLLYNATGQLQLTREDHIKIETALNVIKTTFAEYNKLKTQQKEEPSKQPKAS